jgi:hypothetical protein
MRARAKDLRLSPLAQLDLLPHTMFTSKRMVQMIPPVNQSLISGLQLRQRTN